MGKKEEKFVNRNSDFISTERYEELFTYIKRVHPNTPYLIFSVEDSGGDGLVEGEAETWIEVKENDKNQKQICHMMKDDEGENELEVYEMTLQGLHDAIDRVFDLQDQLQVKEFFNSVLELLKQFKKAKKSEFQKA